MEVRRLRDDELQHHGVKGQRWGVRRYQNYDGSLKDAGKKRYVTSTLNRLEKQNANAQYEYNKAYSNRNLIQKKIDKATNSGKTKKLEKLNKVKEKYSNMMKKSLDEVKSTESALNKSIAKAVKNSYNIDVKQANRLYTPSSVKKETAASYLVLAIVSGIAAATGVVSSSVPIIVASSNVSTHSYNNSRAINSYNVTKREDGKTGKYSISADPKKLERYKDKYIRYQDIKKSNKE